MKFITPSSYMAFVGQNSADQLCAHIGRTGVKNILIVSDKVLVELGVVEIATRAFSSFEVQLTIFDEVTPDPTFAVVAAGAELARQSGSEVVLAIGGGSSIDAAKIIAASAVSPTNPLDWVGFSKLKELPLPLFAIPTTSGTGSEATLGAVISDTESHQKFVIADPGLQPAAIALDSNLLQGMPRGITAATGMDALTHGIEAYISRWDRGNTQQMSGDAVKLIYEHLQSACDNGANLAARDALAIAAYYAGIAINQVNVGNVHAIAHQLGAKYGVPHGVANSLVLPHVLQLSRPSADQLLAQLARNCKMGKPDDSDAELASEFIQGIVRLRANIGMPDVAVDLRVADFPELIQRAVEEGDAYPSPVFFTETEVESVLRSLLPSSEQ